VYDKPSPRGETFSHARGKLSPRGETFLQVYDKRSPRGETFSHARGKLSPRGETFSHVRDRLSPAAAVIANRSAVKRSILAGGWIASAGRLAMTDVKFNSCFITLHGFSLINNT
jgi:hypothetical protein